MMSTADTAVVLGREACALDLDAVAGVLRRRSVLVAGAGGRIGSTLCRTLAQIGVRRIAGFDSDEHALVDLLGSLAPKARTQFREFLCTVRDRARLATVVAQHQPDLIVHAAALKNLRFCERHAAECVLTNLVGVRNVAEAAAHGGGALMVYVSSDKAAAPTSFVGACMRLAELHLSWRDQCAVRDGGALRIASVRLGNVFGSRGSVVGAFRRQIDAGGPVTLTDSAMRRHFMTAEEAVGVILMAAASEKAAGGAYILDTGRPVFIRDIAARMVALSGKDIAIIVAPSGDSEKLEEDLYDEHERVTHSGVNGVLRLQSQSRRPVTTADIDALEALARAGDDAAVRTQVFALLNACLGAACQTMPPRPAAPDHKFAERAPADSHDAQP
ncbi:MAG: O-antigen biosynthesis protein WbqV [Alphaproteobacteria bacterium]|nr:MAG: O-antigen biosynthesis protein WbqV [Caulobacteraceae bacterium]TPW04137.1 MAG: O-antigen biosynthesis protein WbqV [Alphaproteobacteria bacterium]